MSEIKKPFQPTCEDDPEEEHQVRAPRTKPTSKRAQSKPPPTTRKTSAPDTASIDSGYSSKTTATQDSSQSGGAPIRAGRPITSDAPAAASLSPSKTTSLDARRLSTSSAPTTKLAQSPTKIQQQAKQTKHLPPPILPVPYPSNAAATAPRPMAPSQPCHCEECVYGNQQLALQHRSPLEHPMDMNYPPFTRRPQPQVPSPAGQFPPSSYGAPPPRRVLPSGAPKPRPMSYNGPWMPPPLPPQAPALAPAPPPAPLPAAVAADPYHAHPARHYTVATTSHAPHYPPAEPYRRASTTVNASAFAPPPHPHSYPQLSPPSPQRQARLPPGYHDGEAAAHVGMPAQHMNPSAHWAHPGQPVRPQRFRVRGSTSPGVLFTREANDRRLMPPPPAPPRQPHPAPGGLVRSHSSRRPSPPRAFYDHYPHHNEDDYAYDEDGEYGEYVDDDGGAYDRTIRAGRPDMNRPSMRGPHDGHHYYSTSSVPQRTSLELTDVSRRRSSVGHRGRDREKLSDAEAHIAKTSTRPREALTAERVKRINRNSLDSSSRSQKSRGGSERDRASSDVSKGDAPTTIRRNQDNSFEIEGPSTVRVMMPKDDDGTTHFIIEGTGGREQKYHQDGSRTSRASRTSNKSFASRASRTARAGEVVREERQKSASDKGGREKTKAKAKKPEVVVEGEGGK